MQHNDMVMTVMAMAMMMMVVVVVVVVVAITARLILLAYILEPAIVSGMLNTSPCSRTPKTKIS